MSRSDRSSLTAQSLNMAGLLSYPLALWRAVGLTTQFLFLTTLLILALTWVSAVAQRTIAARTMIESSLEIEQSLARVAMLSVIGNTPLKGRLSPGLRNGLDRVIGDKLDARYFNKIKLWGVDGQLLFDSHGDPIAQSWQEPAVLRALKGETVVSLADGTVLENAVDAALGSQVYEVYIPLYATDGRLLAVGEIYCSVELIVERLEEMTHSIQRVQAVVGVVGLFLMGVLVHFAQRRLSAQSVALTEALAASEALVRHNVQLLGESETLRRRSAEAMETLLNTIGADLHDGPIQLLSLASLYRSLGGDDANSGANKDKAEGLSRQALQELRNLSSGLLLPELDGLTLGDCVSRAVEAFVTETGIAVDRHIDARAVKVSKPRQVVAYRIVHEALNNARKHAGGRGLRVDLAIVDGRAEICIRDDGPGLDTTSAVPGGRGERLGLHYMTHRANGVGATLAIGPADARGRGTRVALSLPLTDAD